MKPINSRLFSSLAAAIAAMAFFPAAAQERKYDNWLDAPQTPGGWEYVDEAGESLALFGDANPVHLFVLRCDKQTRQVGIARRGSATGTLLMRIRTETADRSLSAVEVPGYGLVVATVPANDSLLDAMAITKGRIAVEVEGMPALYIPAWAEVGRVVEDCR